METMLERKTIPYNLKNQQEFEAQRNRTDNYCLEYLCNRLPQLWALQSWIKYLRQALVFM